MTRRPSLLCRTTLALGALALTSPALASCGFDKATNRVNTISMGGADRSGQVDVLNAVIVSAQPGSGTLISTLVNNDPTEAAELDLIEAGDETPLEVATTEPVAIDPRGRAVLQGEDGVGVTGEFTPGDVMSLTYTFANGEQSVLEVPVVPACRQWEGLDGSAEALATPEPTAGSADGQGSGQQQGAGKPGAAKPGAGKPDAGKPGAGKGGGSSASPSPTPSPSETTASAPAGSDEIAYECELPEPAAE